LRDIVVRKTGEHKGQTHHGAAEGELHPRISLCSDAQVLINHLLTNAQFASHVRLAFPRRTLALQVGDFLDGQGIRGSRSRIMWVLDDIVGLFSVYAGSFSRNLGRNK
jgi:hypothetical protein